MSVSYADTSALARSYLSDEPGHEQLIRQLREQSLVLTSEITRVELARAVRAAARAGRHRTWHLFLDRFDEDCGPDGPIRLVGLRPEMVFPRARELVLEHPLTTLDAIHLAVALGDGRDLAGEELIFVTRDRAQARAARTLGLAVA